jgi:predicted hotdog family 3-hydroxylacyl-ACP dehydratase
VIVDVTKIGNGSGRLTSEPPGIDCGDTCFAVLPHGATMVLLESVSAVYGSGLIGTAQTSSRYGNSVSGPIQMSP